MIIFKESSRQDINKFQKIQIKKLQSHHVSTVVYMTHVLQSNTRALCKKQTEKLMLEDVDLTRRPYLINLLFMYIDVNNILLFTSFSTFVHGIVDLGRHGHCEQCKERRIFPIFLVLHIITAKLFEWHEGEKIMAKCSFISVPLNTFASVIPSKIFSYTLSKLLQNTMFGLTLTKAYELS